jgi:hypothetical protein
MHVQHPNEQVASATTPAGPLLGGEQLRSALGFRTGEAFRAAARAGRVPVKLLKIEGRRGWFARVNEVSEWQAALSERFKATAVKPNSEEMEFQGPEKTKPTFF